MTIQTTMWPLPYLLKIYKDAIEHGAIRVAPLGGLANYKSLAAAFYRLRRRQDGKHSIYIEESFHLVSVTYDAQRDAAIFIYDKLPDGMALPDITPLEGSEMLAYTETAQMPLPPMPGASEEPPDPHENFSSTDLVEGLLSQVSKKLDSDDEGEGAGDFG